MAHSSTSFSARRRQRFSRWREFGAPLPPGREETLRDLWHAVLHLLSFLNFDQARVRDLFQKTMPTCPTGTGSPLTSPWSGTSLSPPPSVPLTRASGAAGR